MSYRETVENALECFAEPSRPESEPSVRVNAAEIIQINDRVVLRFIITGTHRAPFLGLDATGGSIRFSGIAILRFMNQKCVEC